MFAIASVLLLCIMLEAMAFHRLVKQAKTFLTIESKKQATTRSVGTRVEGEVVLLNGTNLGFRAASLDLTGDHLESQEVLAETPLRVRPGRNKIRTRFRCKIPGRFEVTNLRIILKDRANLFRHSLWLHDKATLIARPTINRSSLASIDSSFLGDLTSDPNRRGRGSDLAGISPPAGIEDLHRVDWKATARVGTLMVKDFYLERQPPIIFVIDASEETMAPQRGGTTFSQLTGIFPSVLASLRPSTPIGLIVYDQNSVITEVSPEAGLSQRDRIIKTLLNCSGPESPLISGPHPYIQKNAPHGSLLDKYRSENISKPVFASINRFLWDRQRRYREKLQTQGAFMALEQIVTLPETFLVIGITHSRMNMNGLIEGGKLAAPVGNRLILLLLTEPHKVPTVYIFPELEQIGLRIRECLPQELPRAIQDEIARMGRERIIPRYPNAG